MGKVWTRDGKANQRETSAGTQTPRFHTHRPTVWTRSAQQSQKAVPVGNQNRVTTATVPQSTWDDANGPAAKRRRLAAKGRLPPSLTTAQNGSASSPGQQQAVKEAAAASEPQLSAWRAAKAAKEAQREAALLQEAAALRRRIAEEEAKLAAAKAAAQKQEAEQAAAQRAKREDQELRKNRLDAGFAEAFKNTRETMASDQKAKATKAADKAEVTRVLAAKSDHEVLQLRAGQADRAAVKKRYRAMTLALHPDKCKAEGATDAFQRLVLAYQGVLKFAR